MTEVLINSKNYSFHCWWYMEEPFWISKSGVVRFLRFVEIPIWGGRSSCNFRLGVCNPDLRGMMERKINSRVIDFYLDHRSRVEPFYSFFCCFFFTFKESVVSCIGFGCNAVYPWNSQSVVWTQTVHPPLHRPLWWVDFHFWVNYPFKMVQTVLRSSVV